MQLSTLSSLLLAWHRLSAQSTLENFRSGALALLEAHLPISAAWWGVAHLRSGSPRVLQSYLHRLPAGFADDWLSSAEIDDLAQTVIEHPGVTVRYNGYETPEEFDANYGIVSALSTAAPAEDTGLVHFLSIYRDDSLPLFTEEDRALVELLMPHLFLAEEKQALATWQSEQANARQLTATVSKHAWLEQATPAFCQVFMAEFPEWFGGHLPNTLRRMIHIGAGQWQGRTLDVSVSQGKDGGCQLSLQRRASLGLTRREETVARAYAAGGSHKEIARDLGLKPATVRGYLQQCYLKLNVSNKVSLGDALRGGSGHRP
ncbi:LuxR C-terminal-related transcriptional regulator [Pseudomonas sp. SCB32]|uniref:helix-turn-helix transcriptional regulator n=1 Tax=Pseudomonas sp. SCB32 TaxID=2653853 RepID=UPI0015B61B39|nr:LuxR C-terminal-related transcriptional regulator [Pseudomonas sp. SCB32]